MRKPNWEADAELQLLNLLEFVGERNASAAARLKATIDEAIGRSCQFPEIGRPGRVAGTRELIVHPNYIVVYQITETAIDVLRLLHARQLYP
ncbi:type II toxin-antitoxin system RelE/ParE family toxin [Sphingomonas sp. BT-65]|uniref:type II toxin-antitoxin system RelE/ParE family toxin n=1 Tax=Sphingomonas sp. BT-65 TaxID=2989821 RepID=UPI0022356694|nr:type II toxin-antitoxin system RelE/ParE family toxin [Sphingomonas sp. BT-65]MCW4460590.1 type II toxin-antitoxin system RelE/ParE family toxin [Sphingomonas sp. BT-65]